MRNISHISGCNFTFFLLSSFIGYTIGYFGIGELCHKLFFQYFWRSACVWVTFEGLGAGVSVILALAAKVMEIRREKIKQGSRTDFHVNDAEVGKAVVIASKKCDVGFGVYNPKYRHTLTALAQIKKGWLSLHKYPASGTILYPYLGSNSCVYE